MKAIDKIADKLEELIKKRIKDLGLVKTGSLLNSVKVIVSDETFEVEANDYYEKLDEEYDISKYVLESREFQNYIAEVLEKEIDNELDKL